ncbi:hypothetical protein [Brachybacterium sp. 107]|uniref:hypothetical protein n=1 Tax=Brachybacterium sp. 107 TaxID=3457736 RepID=UPI0040337D45
MSSQTVPAPPAPSSDRIIPSPSPSPSPSSTRASSWSLALSLVALLGAVAAMAGVGLTVIPLETASGYYLTDTPVAYQWAVLAAFGSLLLWTVLGLMAIVLGIVGMTRGAGQVRAIVAIGVAVIAPVLAVLTLMGSMAIGADGLL